MIPASPSPRIPQQRDRGSQVRASSNPSLPSRLAGTGTTRWYGCCWRTARRRRCRTPRAGRPSTTPATPARRLRPLKEGKSVQGTGAAPVCRLLARACPRGNPNSDTCCLWAQAHCAVCLRTGPGGVDAGAHCVIYPPPASRGDRPRRMRGAARGAGKHGPPPPASCRVHSRAPPSRRAPPAGKRKHAAWVSLGGIGLCAAVCDARVQAPSSTLEMQSTHEGCACACACACACRRR